MKKILLLWAVLLGAVTASQAGVALNIGVGIPVPRLVIRPPIPVIAAPVPYCPPRIVAPYVAPPAVVVGPPVIGYGCGPVWHGPVWHGHGRGHWHRR